MTEEAGGAARIFAALAARSRSLRQSSRRHPRGLRLRVTHHPRASGSARRRRRVQRRVHGVHSG